MVVGGMRGMGGHVWQGGHVWHGGACVGGRCMPRTPPQHHEIWSVNAWAVRILLECILVFFMFCLL